MIEGFTLKGIGGGIVSGGSFSARVKNGVILFRTGRLANYNPGDEIDATVTIAFPEGPFEKEDIVPTLVKLSAYLERIITDFEPFG